MGVPYGNMKQLIQDAFDDDSNEFALQIRRVVNTAYRDIAADHVWQTLLTTLTVSGGVLPADMDHPVIYVQDDTDYIMFPISETQRYLSPQLFNWYPDGHVEWDDVLVYASDGAININGTTLTSAAPSVDFNDSSLSLAGEFVRIGNNEGFYKIDSVTDANNLELVRGFRGADDSDVDTPANLTAQYYEIRPQGTLKIGFSDEYGDALDTSSSLLVWYQRQPLPVYNDYDMIYLPGTCEAVRIQAFRRLLEGAKYDNDALKQEREYQRAINRMKPLHPTIGREPRPRNRLGNQVRFGRYRTMKRTNQNNRRILGV